MVFRVDQVFGKFDDKVVCKTNFFHYRGTPGEVGTPGLPGRDGMSFPSSLVMSCLSNLVFYSGRGAVTGRGPVGDRGPNGLPGRPGAPGYPGIDGRPGGSGAPGIFMKLIF